MWRKANNELSKSVPKLFHIRLLKHSKVIITCYLHSKEPKYFYKEIKNKKNSAFFSH